MFWFAIWTTRLASLPASKKESRQQSEPSLSTKRRWTPASSACSSPDAPSSVPAAEDLESIKNYLTEHYPHFAEPTVRTIYERIRFLKDVPNRGTPAPPTGTRELPLTPLPAVVVYSVRGEAVEILHIYHGAQDWR